ncbi:RHS Repeat [Delftia tsuruhatensis]|uniref:DUF4226 domain-containing protein n=1 Tax=Delftia tsuruhatensis TaxID=180282 RepID=UPI001E7BD7B8|nr:DUF4226 domain-containing protein [Delftia tsuruhatensis]CAB5719321.1 RHS Repeat [Delftia tsuruhatensis]CAC9687847.1 RHS Repeat [Delftia tsuruhatensis]
MTLHDDKTAQGWPLPHPDNRLEDDVLRLRQAVQDVDQALATARQLIDTKAGAQGVQDAMDIVAQRIEQLDTAVQSLSTGKVASVNGVAGINITLNPEHITLGPANGAASESFGYDAQGRISTITRSINGFSATTAVSYDGAGRVAQQQTSYRGRVRTQTYAYDAATGRVSGVNATEVQG